MTADESRRLQPGDEVSYLGGEPVTATVIRTSQLRVWLKYSDGYEGSLSHHEMLLFARGRYGEAKEEGA